MSFVEWLDRRTPPEEPTALSVTTEALRSVHPFGDNAGDQFPDWFATWLNQATPQALAALQATGYAVVKLPFFVLQIEHRNDGGPMTVGPFASREAAFDYAHSLAHPGWEASYEAVPVAAAAREADPTRRQVTHQ